MQSGACTSCAQEAASKSLALCLKETNFYIYCIDCIDSDIHHMNQLAGQGLKVVKRWLGSCKALDEMNVRIAMRNRTVMGWKHGSRFVSGQGCKDSSRWTWVASSTKRLSKRWTTFFRHFLRWKRPRPVLFARMTLAAMPESTREEAGSLDFGALVLWTWFGEKKVERHWIRNTRNTCRSLTLRCWCNGPRQLWRRDISMLQTSDIIRHSKNASCQASEKTSEHAAWQDFHGKSCQDSAALVAWQRDAKRETRPRLHLMRS